eukprot:1061300-Karenia_brevis.AAC.1
MDSSKTLVSSTASSRSTFACCSLSACATMDLSSIKQKSVQRVFQVLKQVHMPAGAIESPCGRLRVGKSGSAMSPSTQQYLGPVQAL